MLLSCLEYFICFSHLDLAIWCLRGSQGWQLGAPFMGSQLELQPEFPNHLIVRGTRDIKFNIIPDKPWLRRLRAMWLFFHGKNWTFLRMKTSNIGKITGAELHFPMETDLQMANFHIYVKFLRVPPSQITSPVWSKWNEWSQVVSDLPFTYGGFLK